jgi:hypothetical protein
MGAVTASGSNDEVMLSSSPRATTALASRTATASTVATLPRPTGAFPAAAQILEADEHLSGYVADQRVDLAVEVPLG